MSELCEAQETRGSKFIYEFGRNSTVYCFVASGLLYSSISNKKVATSDASKEISCLNKFLQNL